MRFVLVGDNTGYPGYVPGYIEQRTWTKNGAKRNSAPTLTLTERDGKRFWEATAYGRSWTDERRPGKTAAQCLRDDAREMIAMADAIEHRDLLDAMPKPRKRRATKAEKRSSRDGTSEVPK